LHQQRTFTESDRVNDDSSTPQPNLPDSPTSPPGKAPAPTAASTEAAARPSMPALTLLAADDAFVCVDELCAPVEDPR
jgi:hypothetical protein